MKRSSFSHLIALSVGLPAALILTSCSPNPADGVSKAAEVTEGEVMAAAADTAGEGTVYVFTDASKIEFTGSKVTGKHDGGFTVFTGQFMTDGKALLGTENLIEIDMTSTWSDNEKLTGHLKSDDFFDVEKFPTAEFKLLEVRPGGVENAWTLIGDFTLHGVTKKISFPATIVADGETAMLQAEFVINRKDYEIVFPGMPDDLIRDEVVIRLDIKAEPKAA